MARGWQAAVLHALGAKDHVLTVTDRREISPGFVEIGFHGTTLFDDVQPGPTSWIRLWFPSLDGSSRMYQRGYTIATASPDSGELTVDFVVHEPTGPASAWARDAAPGQSVIAQYLGSRPVHADHERLLLVGDATSVPAINHLLDDAGDREVEVFLEHAEEHQTRIPLTAHPRMRLTRVPRRGPGSLAEALADRDWSGWQVWAGCESGSLKALRPMLRGRTGASKENTHLQAYWVAGRAMGSDRE